MSRTNTTAQEIPQEIERFNIIFRIQHILMFSTFLILSFTGWGLKYAYEPQGLSSIWIRIWGGAETAGLIHRIAGVTMLVDFIWHVLYLGYLFATKRMTIDLKTTVIPLPKDVFDVIKNFMYFLGLSKEKARFGKYSYAQKFDYWAVFWGMFIIGFSGYALAFPMQVSYIIPEFTTGWIWQLLGIMHSDEALLAIVFILFWHFYNEHLKPEVFPMSWIWITGKISTEKLKHHHPIEYEMLFPDEAKKDKKE
ncbi:MAG: cytochrome b/b6 domain-containing protein [Nitrospirota bacterium]